MWWRMSYYITQWFMLHALRGDDPVWLVNIPEISWWTTTNTDNVVCADELNRSIATSFCATASITQWSVGRSSAAFASGSEPFFFSSNRQGFQILWLLIWESEPYGSDAFHGSLPGEHRWVAWIFTQSKAFGMHDSGNKCDVLISRKVPSLVLTWISEHSSFARIQMLM